MNRKVSLESFFVLLAVVTAVVPFAAPIACADALKEGLALCGGPLLLSLFPFLIVSALIVQCGAAGMLGAPFRILSRGLGVKADCAGGILLLGWLGGFAPAAKAVAQAVQIGELDQEQASKLLPACIGSGPSFVILSVGQSMLGSASLGVRLFAAQTAAGYLSALVLHWLSQPRRQNTDLSSQSLSERFPVRLDAVIGDAAFGYLRLCGFILYFRMLAAGLGSLLPGGGALVLAMLLEVCSGCDMASQAARWGSMLCCTALSLQGISALMQVRSLCPEQVSLVPLLKARVLHLPISLFLFWAFLPRNAVETFGSLEGTVIVLRRVPPDCAVLVLAGCCLLACRLSASLPVSKAEQRDLSED